MSALYSKCGSLKSPGDRSYVMYGERGYVVFGEQRYETYAYGLKSPDFLPWGSDSRNRVSELIRTDPARRLGQKPSAPSCHRSTHSDWSTLDQCHHVAESGDLDVTKDSWQWQNLGPTTTGPSHGLQSLSALSLLVLLSPPPTLSTPPLLWAAPSFYCHPELADSR